MPKFRELGSDSATSRKDAKENSTGPIFTGPLSFLKKSLEDSSARQTFGELRPSKTLLAHPVGDVRVPVITGTAARLLVKRLGSWFMMDIPYSQRSIASFANSDWRRAYLTYSRSDPSADHRPLCFTSNILLLRDSMSRVAPPCWRLYKFQPISRRFNSRTASLKLSTNRLCGLQRSNGSMQRSLSMRTEASNRFVLPGMSSSIGCKRIAQS